METILVVNAGSSSLAELVIPDQVPEMRLGQA
jgi:hypothetical protein